MYIASFEDVLSTELKTYISAAGSG